MTKSNAADGYYVAGELTMLIFNYLHNCHVEAPTVHQRLMSFGRESQMPISTWWDTLEDLHAINPDPYLGFHIGQHVQLLHSGVLGYLIAQNETLGDSLSCFQRFQTLLHNYGPVHVHRTGTQIDVNWDYQGKTSTLLSDQVFVSSLLSIVRSITGNHSASATEIRFQQAAPVTSKTPMACPIVYHADTLGISFPAQALNLPIMTADPFLLGVMSRQAQALKSQWPDQFLQAVENRILYALSSGMPSAEAVAAELNMSRRSLHRRLAHHGVNFHDTLRQTRMKLADLYLKEPQLSLTEIAFLLGYSEQSAFNRAFRQWRGSTPERYKRMLG